MTATTTTTVSLLDLTMIPFYCIGLLGFFTNLLSLCSTRRKTKPFLYYVQDFLYTIICIVSGIMICYSFELSAPVTKFSVILSGLFGSTIIRKLVSRKNKIADDITNKLEDKINQQ